jgi:hypothetical protein
VPTTKPAPSQSALASEIGLCFWTCFCICVQSCHMQIDPHPEALCDRSGSERAIAGLHVELQPPPGAALAYVQEELQHPMVTPSSLPATGSWVTNRWAIITSTRLKKDPQAHHVSSFCAADSQACLTTSHYV